MSKPANDPANAERLLAFHDELDALDKKESYTGLAFFFFLVAVVLFAFGTNRESLYLMVNGMFSVFGGVVLGGLEISKLRRIKRLQGKIQEIEQRQIEAPHERGRLGSPD